MYVLYHLQRWEDQINPCLAESRCNLISQFFNLLQSHKVIVAQQIDSSKKFSFQILKLMFVSYETISQYLCAKSVRCSIFEKSFAWNGTDLATTYPVTSFCDTFQSLTNSTFSHFCYCLICNFLDVWICIFYICQFSSS